MTNILRNSDLPGFRVGLEDNPPSASPPTEPLIKPPAAPVPQWPPNWPYPWPKQP